MKLIPLTRGEFAMVDDEDLHLVMSLHWQCHIDPKNGRKYAVTTLYNPKRTVSMHRLILEHDLDHTDHHDGNGLNNQKENIRPATRTQNGQNRQLQVHSAKFKGVQLDKRTGHNWYSRIRIAGKLKHLGYFNSPVEAAKAYDVAALDNFGAFARTNKELGLYV